MTVNVKLFAALRDVVGQAALSLDVAEGRAAAQIAEQIAEKYPQVEKYLKRIAYAVNQEYVPGTTVLKDGDELALIPPVSGG